VKVEPSRLPTTDIFVHNLISRIKHNTKGGRGGLIDSRNSTQQ